MNKVNLKGRVFDKLTVIKANGHKSGRTAWLCRCECGNPVTVAANNLGRGTKSCGCLKSLVTSTRNRTHGLSYVPEYGVWWNMIARCRYKSADKNKRYVYRGIKVCESWQSFENFYKDMGPRPSRSHSLDRIDNDGNYEPGNCRWDSRTTQANNRSSNNLITLNGQTKSLIEWERSAGLKHGVISKRLKLGWSLEKALTQPSRRML